jgi:hypothetical protein
MSELTIKDAINYINGAEAVTVKESINHINNIQADIDFIDNTRSELEQLKYSQFKGNLLKFLSEQRKLKCSELDGLLNETVLREWGSEPKENDENLS